MNTDKTENCNPENSNDLQNQAIFDAYNKIMKNFADNPLFHQEWKKIGDNYEKTTLYDESIVCVTGIL